MKLKGQATIELTNVESGEKRVVKDNNMITNALSVLLRTFPGESYTPLCKIFYPDQSSGTYMDGIDNLTPRNSKKRTVEMLTGGLILFDGQIDENPENILPPSGVEIVGCGTSLAYGGSNLMAGSYNAAESGEIENGYKHVWDFSTAHGNGHIACACLSTREGGYSAGGTFPYDPSYVLSRYSGKTTEIDYQDQLSRRHARISNRDSSKNVHNDDILYIDGLKNKMICLHDAYEFYMNGGYYYYHTSTDATYQKMFWHKNKMALTFDVKRCPITSFGIFDYALAAGEPRSYLVPGSDAGIILDTVTVNIPDQIKTLINNHFSTSSSSNYLFYEISNDEGFIYITFRFYNSSNSNYRYWNPNEKIYVWKIDAETFESSVIEVTNTTGKNLCFYASSGSGNTYASKQSVYVGNDYSFAIANDGCVYKIKNSDNTDVQQIFWPDGEPFIHSIASTAYETRFASPFFLDGKFYFSTYVVDMASNIVKHRNILSNYMFGYTAGITSSNGYQYYEGPVIVIHGVKGLIGKKYSSLIGSSSESGAAMGNQLCLSFLPELLVTINNLSKPVTKSSAETMKITYTLTWDLEGGDS